MIGSTDLIKKSILEGFSHSDITTTKILTTLLITYAIAMYIHFVYKIVTKNAFYFKNFGVSMTVISVVTAGIVLAMQSSLVISLGMVGALSIVRFRTAVKDPMDLLFLFWSIGTGIVCGAGLYELAIITALVTTLGIVILEFMPLRKKMCLLVINALSVECEHDICSFLSKKCKGYKIRSKNINRTGMDLIIEIHLASNDINIVNELLKIQQIDSVSLLENEQNIKV